MKILKIILGVISVIFLVVFLGSLFLPKSYYFERSIEIEAPAENVFPLIGELRNWPQWSPLNEMDPGMKTTYGPSTSGVGGSNSWVGEKAGKGSMRITEYVSPTRMTCELKFKDWEDSPSYATFTLVPNEDRFTLTWSFKGEFSGNPIKRYFGILFEKLVGEQYETGLVNIKTLVEAE